MCTAANHDQLHKEATERASAGAVFLHLVRIRLANKFCTFFRIFLKGFYLTMLPCKREVPSSQLLNSATMVHRAAKKKVGGGGRERGGEGGLGRAKGVLPFTFYNPAVFPRFSLAALHTIAALFTNRTTETGDPSSFCSGAAKAAALS